MIRIGITGGIGMGKSSLAATVAASGIPVVDTDQLARDLVAPGQPALGEIREAFGLGILCADGSLDRAALGGRVFADAGVRARLEAILHPRIRAAWEALLATWADEAKPAGAVVIPLLFETAAESVLGPVVCVACTPATQRVRLRARGWSEAEIDQRIAAQLPVEEKVRRSRFVVWTEPPPIESARQWERIRRDLGL